MKKNYVFVPNIPLDFIIPYDYEVVSSSLHPASSTMDIKVYHTNQDEFTISRELYRLNRKGAF